MLAHPKVSSSSLKCSLPWTYHSLVLPGLLSRLACPEGALRVLKISSFNSTNFPVWFNLLPTLQSIYFRFTLLLLAIWVQTHLSSSLFNVSPGICYHISNGRACNTHFLCFPSTVCDARGTALLVFLSDASVLASNKTSMVLIPKWLHPCSPPIGWC